MQLVQTETQNATSDHIEILCFKGSPAIRHFTSNQHKSTAIYSEENILFFVLEGAITIQCAYVNHEISQHKIAFIKRNTFFELEENREWGPGVKTEYLQFNLANELVREFAKIAVVAETNANETFPIVVSHAEKNLQNYFASLEPYIQLPQTIDTNVVKLKILELLFCLSKLSNGIITHLLDIKDHFHSDITAMVEENITNSISLRELAILSGRSLSSFRRDFTAIYKMPPRQWITKRKLEKSKELLMNTTMTITDICYMMGFENISHFSRLFKSRFGCPPTIFRLNLPL